MPAALEFVWFAYQTTNSQDKTFLYLEYVPLWIQSVSAPRPKLRLLEEWWYALDLLNDQLKLSFRPAHCLSAKNVATIRCILLTSISQSTRKINGKRQECPQGIGIKWGCEDLLKTVPFGFSVEKSPPTWRKKSAPPLVVAALTNFSYVIKNNCKAEENFKFSTDRIKEGRPYQRCKKPFE